MNNFIRTGHCFDSEPFISNRIYIDVPSKHECNTYDQNGYSLTPLEVMYYENENLYITYGGTTRQYTNSKQWFRENQGVSINDGPVINHSQLFQKKGFAGEALEQLTNWGRYYNPCCFKIANIVPKWGIDMSIDWVDRLGNVFEILHFEWDDFNLDNVESIREQVEVVVLNTDWLDAGRHLLNRKDEWHSLPFFEQSKWKTDYFGLPEEKFKMVNWK